MNNINLISVKIDAVDEGYVVVIPDSLLFELVEIAPGMVGKIGLTDTHKQFQNILKEVQNCYKTVPSIYSEEIDDDAKVHLRRCAILAVLQAILSDTPLQIESDIPVETYLQAGWALQH